ncbi:hypothetical protein HOO68_06115 [Candidatus Gracilibacteria bacterium]|nr:hypothetical protein [Candidatus Gracilibacteria bacterium]
MTPTPGEIIHPPTMIHTTPMNAINSLITLYFSPLLIRKWSRDTVCPL